jgi:hypothetical protein
VLKALSSSRSNALPAAQQQQSEREIRRKMVFYCLVVDLFPFLYFFYSRNELRLERENVNNEINQRPKRKIKI